MMNLIDILQEKNCAQEMANLLWFGNKKCTFLDSMAFNDLFSFDLEKGFTIIELYRAN